MILRIAAVLAAAVSVTAQAPFSCPDLPLQGAEKSSARIALLPLLDERDELKRGQMLPDSVYHTPWGDALGRCLSSALGQRLPVQSPYEGTAADTGLEHQPAFELSVSIRHYYIERSLNPLYIPFFICGFFPTLLLEDKASVNAVLELKLKETMTGKLIDSRLLVKRVEGACASDAGILGYDKLFPALNKCHAELMDEAVRFVLNAAGNTANYVAANAPQKNARPLSQMLVAVMDFDGDAVPKNALAALTDRFRTDIMTSRGYRVLERDQMGIVLKEQGFQQSGACSNTECLVHIGQLVSAQRIVTGTIAGLGAIYLLNAREIDVETGEVLSSVSMDCPARLEELPEALRKLARGLAK